MGNVKIRYYVTRRAWQNSRATWGYWVPTPKMRKHGFVVTACGEDGPRAWAMAHELNRKWDDVKQRLRRGEKVEAGPRNVEIVYPPGSLGEGFARFRATRTWLEKKPRTREDWLRGWKQIGPVFGDVDPSTVSLEDVDAWYATMLEVVSVREAFRAMKIWRALWRVVATLNAPSGRRYCDRDRDPSLGIRRKTPQARQAIWREGEAVRLVKRAIRMGHTGLAAAIAVAWDTMLSPVDVRGLTTAQLTPDRQGPLFSVERAKTGRAAIGTLSARTERLLAAYVASLPFRLHPGTPIFHTRGIGRGLKGGMAPYSKDTLGDDFREVRQAEFPGDKRTLQDFRRSGAVEAAAGEVDPGALAGKMANTIDRNRELQQTYQPHTATLVRLADQARTRGRSRMRGDNGPGSKS